MRTGPFTSLKKVEYGQPEPWAALKSPLWWAMSSEDHIRRSCNNPDRILFIVSLMNQVMAFYIEAVTRSAINGCGVACLFILEYIGI